MNTSGRKTERGQSVIVVALMFLALVVLVALAVDMSDAYSVRRTAQNAADAAALAGGKELGRYINDEGSSSDQAVKEQMNLLAEQNGIEDTDPDNSATNDNVEGYYLDANQVRIPKVPPIGSQPSGKIPKDALGVEAIVYNNAPSFFGGVVGRDAYAIQADAAVVFNSSCTGSCMLPIAIHTDIAEKPFGFEEGKCYNLWDGDGDGAFGWLNWSLNGASCKDLGESDDCSATCLKYNMAPDSCRSGTLEVKLRVGGAPGVKDASEIRDWLDFYIGKDSFDFYPVKIVVYDYTEGTKVDNKSGGCGKLGPDGEWNGQQAYHVAGFAGFRMTGYRLSNGNCKDPTDPKCSATYDLPCEYAGSDYTCINDDSNPDVYLADPKACEDFPTTPTEEQIETGEVNRITGIFKLRITDDTYNCAAVGNVLSPRLVK